MQRKVTKLAILGSTGSIGCQVLDIARSFRDCFEITGLAAGDNVTAFMRQVEEFKPRFITCNHNEALHSKAEFLSMENMAAHPDVDMVIVATTGKAGLHPTLAALKAGKHTAIANKEILVMAGEIITALAAKHDALILPIDSEHSAVWQCLRGEEGPVKRLLLTASGGPFFGQSNDKLAGVTVKQALDHPTWKMGKKVTIDSATLFNKGMEAIEARWLFNIPYEKIEILVHRQSVIHSMVEFSDGSIKAQLSTPDMRLPIQYALFYPDRMPNNSLSSIDFSKIRTLTFEPVNYDQFPCLKLALEAARKGGTYPAALCAADEIAVQLFLAEQIKFTEITNIIETTLNLHKPPAGAGLAEIISTDAWARETAFKAARKGK
jgi:1-deoxy-D-xylulose-5-phosphate reductoisomerase